MDFSTSEQHKDASQWAPAHEADPGSGAARGDQTASVEPAALGPGTTDGSQLSAVFGHLTDPAATPHGAAPAGPTQDEQHLPQKPSVLPAQLGAPLATEAKPKAPTAAPKVTSNTEVSQAISDAPYGWTAAYSFQKRSDGSLQVIIKAKISADDGITPKQIAKVKSQTQSAFQKYWNNKFTLTDAAGTKHPLGISLQFVDSAEHLHVSLHAGEGRDNLSNWYVDSIANDRAHELGHQLGMKDEYVDAGATDRATATAPGVFTDHSIMGNYYEEGAAKAHVHLRHGNVLAGAISAATGEQYTASLNTPAKKKPKAAPPH